MSRSGASCTGNAKIHDLPGSIDVVADVLFRVHSPLHAMDELIERSLVRQTHREIAMRERGWRPQA